MNMSGAIQEQREHKPEKDAVVLLGHHEAWSGPLPPPEILARFEQAVPGSAGRIMTMAETQQKHRIDVEKTVAVQETQIKREGLSYAYRIAFIGLVGAVLIALITKSPAAVGLIITGGLLPLVSKFIPRGKKKRE